MYWLTAVLIFFDEVDTKRSSDSILVASPGIEISDLFNIHSDPHESIIIRVYPEPESGHRPHNLDFVVLASLCKSLSCGCIINAISLPHPEPVAYRPHQ
jgi:hypothetical protein